MRRTRRKKEKLTLRVVLDSKKTTIRYPMPKKLKITVVMNNQFSNAANVTQIANGAGRSGAAGNNAAVASSNTQQQQSVGAEGEAGNSGMGREQTERHIKHRKRKDEEEIVIVVNNQMNVSEQSSTPTAATQVASGGGTFSASGTNASIESSNTKQQHAVGGSKEATATNDGMDSKQAEI